RSIIAGRYERVTPSTAARFRRMSGSHSSGPVSTKVFTVMPSGGMPALFTRMSTGPVARTMPGTASRSVTSATTGWAAPPSSSISRTTFSARSPYRSLTHTSAPARASWMQMARPTPPPPPVTMATRPAMKFDQSRIVATAGSDLYDDGDDRRAPLRPLVDEPAQGAPRVPADRLEVGGALLGRLRQRGEHRGLAVLEQLVGFGCVHPAARHDLGPGDHLARGGVDGHDHHDHALLGEAATVAQHAMADVADDPVDVEIARRHRPPVDVHTVRPEREDVAVLADDDAVVGQPDLARQAGVVDHVPVLAVHGNEPFRLGQVQHELELFAGRVT